MKCFLPLEYGLEYKENSCEGGWICSPEIAENMPGKQGVWGQNKSKSMTKDTNPLLRNNGIKLTDNLEEREVFKFYFSSEWTLVREQTPKMSVAGKILEQIIHSASLLKGIWSQEASMSLLRNSNFTLTLISVSLKEYWIKPYSGYYILREFLAKDQRRPLFSCQNLN